MNHPIVRLLIAVVAGYLLRPVLAALLPFHIGFSPVLWFLVWILTATGVWFLWPSLLRALRKGTTATALPVPSGQEPFTATHRCKNLAIDANSGRVWAKDDRGKVWVLEKDDIRSWNHRWTDLAHQYRGVPTGVSSCKNYIELNTRSLDHPTIRVLFNQWSDAWGFGAAKKNHEQAVEWHARLSTFINS
ncbi:hypothetical protein [Rhodanobacter umsongensis]